MASKSVLSINEEQLSFYWLIGLSVTQWAHVEHSLYQIAYRAFGSDRHEVLGGAFFSIENFRSKLAFVERAMQGADHLKEFAEEWALIREFVRGLSSRRNELAHSSVRIFPAAPEGRRYAIVPLFGPEPGIRHNPNHPPPGSLCIRDIDLIRLQFSKAFVRLNSLYFRMGGQEDPLEEHAQQEPRAQTLVQLARQIRAMCEPREQSSRE